MKILMVEPSGEGKLSQYTYTLSSFLMAAGHELTLVTGKNLVIDAGDVRLVKLFGRRVGPLTYYRFFKLIRRFRPNVVHLQWIPSALFALVMGAAKRLMSPALLYTAHNVMPHRARFYHWPCFGFLYRAVDMLLAHSDVDREELLRLFALDADKVQVVPVGNPLGWQPGETKAAARRRLGLDASVPLLLFFGYVSPAKGIYDCLDAFRLVKDKVSRVKLLVVGKALDERVAEALAKQEDVIARPSYVSNEEAAAYFTACDLVLLPYRKANQSPIVPMAYAFGKPVVASDHQIETVIQGQTGYLVPPREPAVLAEAIVSILTGPGELESLSRGAAELAAKRYSGESVAAAHEAVYRRALGDS